MRLYVCPEANTEVRVLVVSEWYRQQLKKLTHEWIAQYVKKVC